ncbi:MAG: hypothetical protein AAF587_01255 [Bacteroidota bacterium]
MKQILIAISILAASLFLFMGGVKMLVSHIYNRTDCERFNIDNIEVRTGIDIPSVSEADCTCDQIAKTKRSTFTINTQQVDLDEYLTTNKFVEQDGAYVNAGEREDTKWKAKLDPETHVLTVMLEYKM